MDSLLRTLSSKRKSKRKKKRSQESLVFCGAPNVRKPTLQEYHYENEHGRTYRFTYVSSDKSGIPIWNMNRPSGKVSEVRTGLGQVKDSISSQWHTEKDLEGLEPVYRTAYEFNPVKVEELKLLVGYPRITATQELKLRLIALGMHMLTFLAVQLDPHVPLLVHPSELPPKVQPMWMFGICEALAAFRFLSLTFKKLRVDYGNMQSVFAEPLATAYFFCELDQCSTDEVLKDWATLHRFVATPYRYMGSFLDSHYMLHRVVFISPVNNEVSTIEDIAACFPDVMAERRIWQQIQYAKRLRFTTPKPFREEFLRGLSISLLPSSKCIPLSQFDLQIDDRFVLFQDRQRQTCEDNRNNEETAPRGEKEKEKEKVVVHNQPKHWREKFAEDPTSFPRDWGFTEKGLLEEVKTTAAAFNTATKALQEYRRRLSPTTKGMACLDKSSSEVSLETPPPLLSLPGPSAPITVSEDSDRMSDEEAYVRCPYDNETGFAD